ncbi:MAG: hypothetical protein NT027_03320 [Proteobacteria bacterium]|nr:hypothetical protein [Pseudomonadota bacterium]
MNRKEFSDLLNHIAQAWSRRDHSEVLKAFAPDVHYADPLRYSFKSKDELKEFFGPDNSGPLQQCVIHLTLFDEESQIGAAEYTYIGHHQYRGVALIQLKDGFIIRWREYQHIDTRSRTDFLSGTEFQ